MATTAKIAKEQKKPKFKVRLRNRCKNCGRPRGFLLWNEFGKVDRARALIAEATPLADGALRGLLD